MFLQESPTSPTKATWWIQTLFTIGWLKQEHPKWFWTTWWKVKIGWQISPTFSTDQMGEDTQRIQVRPKKGKISTIPLRRWDLEHQSYSREGSGFIAIEKDLENRGNLRFFSNSFGTQPRSEHLLRILFTEVVYGSIYFGKCRFPTLFPQQSQEEMTRRSFFGPCQGVGPKVCICSGLKIMHPTLSKEYTWDMVVLFLGG